MRLNRRATEPELGELRASRADVRVAQDERPAVVRISREAESLSVAIAESLDDVADLPGLQVYWVEPDS